MNPIPAESGEGNIDRSWGIFAHSFSGIIEVSVGKQAFLAPPHMGVWIPPGEDHTWPTAEAAGYCFVYVPPQDCNCLPANGCTLFVSPLIQAMLEYLHCIDGTEDSPERMRLLQVVVDQLSSCEVSGTYMRYSDMPPLSEILAQLRLNPADGRSLAELAQNFSIGERTLMRMCRRDLGVSLTEWRQRLRTIHALPLLRSGKTVEIVARELGYGSASAFIATFRRIIGVSPGKFCVSVKDR